MATSYRIEGRWVTISCEGDYTVAEFCANAAAAVADASWPRDPLVLFDLCARTVQVDRTKADEAAIARCIGRFAAEFDHRYAVIAPLDVHFGLIRIAAVVMERYGIEVHVVRDEEEAREWLAAGNALD
jgi:hypothetical protein